MQKIISYFLRRSISSEEKQFFIQHLSLMLKAGVSMPRAIEILALQTKNNYWKKILDDVRSELIKGNSLEKSFARHQEIFGISFINMVRVGELKGDVASVLDNFFRLMQMEEAIKRKVKSASFYPIIILVAMFVLGLATVFYIFPHLVSIFEEADIKLPLPTRIIIGISNFFTQYGILITGFLILLLILFVFLLRNPKVKYLFHLFWLKLPMISSIVKERNLARLSRNLSTLLKAGVPISEALLATSNVLNNLAYRQSVLEAREEIKRGKFVHNAFAKHPEIYPNLIIQIMIVGEEAGVLDEVLGEVASFYERKVITFLESLSSIIEPILILILGLGVAFLALSVLLPIYSLAEI